MPDEETIQALLKRLMIHRRTLEHYLDQQAKLSRAYAPPVVSQGIYEARAEIRWIKEELRGWGVTVEDLRDDEENDAGAAVVLLGRLPLEEVPERATLPRGSRMPFSCNPLFVGREDDLKRLADALKGDPAKAIVLTAAVTGLAGIGKTQLACEFAHRYGRYFEGGVFWLSFADQANIPAEVAACAAALGLPGLDALSLDKQVAQVQQEWQAAQPRLLVFDNCEDEALLAQWRPTTGGCRVLVTSRCATWDDALGVAEFALGVLGRAESIALLRKFRPDLAGDDTDLDLIASELGDLPLALHLAGSFLKLYRSSVTPAAYLAELRGAAVLDHESLRGIDLKISPTNHALHVGRTFALIYEQLRPEDVVDALAIALLVRVACFAPGAPIPRDLQMAVLNVTDSLTERKASRALNRLRSLGLLVETADGALTMHRLVAHFVRETVQDKAAQDAVEHVLLDRAYELSMKNESALLSPILAHLRHVTEAALARVNACAADEHTELRITRTAQTQSLLKAASLCANLGASLQVSGDYKGAQWYCEQTLIICERVFDSEHPGMVTILGNLAAMLKMQGQYEQAWSLYKQAVGICEQDICLEHPDTATIFNNLAQLLAAQGDDDQACLLHEKAILLWEQTEGPIHPDMAVSLNNLAQSLAARGDYDRARAYMERAVAICRQALGLGNPETMTCINNLAELLHTMGHHDQARALYEEVIASREQGSKQGHPVIAISLNNLAMLLEARGDYTRAQACYEEAISICEQTLGPADPTAVAILNNLTMLCEAQSGYNQTVDQYATAA